MVSFSFSNGQLFSHVTDGSTTDFIPAGRTNETFVKHVSDKFLNLLE